MFLAINEPSSSSFTNTFRELAEPQKLLTYLLQPKVLTLASETVAVYLQAAIKVFGSWTAELADRWDDDDLTKVRSSVDTVVEQASEFASNSDIEIQERVRGLFHLHLITRSHFLALLPTRRPFIPNRRPTSSSSSLSYKLI